MEKFEFSLMRYKNVLFYLKLTDNYSSTFGHFGNERFFFMAFSLGLKFCIEHKRAGLLTFFLKNNCDFFLNVDQNQLASSEASLSGSTLL